MLLGVLGVFTDGASQSEAKLRHTVLRRSWMAPARLREHELDGLLVRFVARGLGASAEFFEEAAWTHERVSERVHERLEVGCRGTVRSAARTPEGDGWRSVRRPAAGAAVAGGQRRTPGGDLFWFIICSFSIVRHFALKHPCAPPGATLYTLSYSTKHSHWHAPAHGAV